MTNYNREFYRNHCAPRVDYKQLENNYFRIYLNFAKRCYRETLLINGQQNL